MQVKSLEVIAEVKLIKILKGFHCTNCAQAGPLSFMILIITPLNL